MDLLCDKLATPVAFGGTTGQSRDLMASYQSPLGGTVSVAYTATSAFPSTNNPPPRYAVTGITTNDGRGGVATTSYTYSGGFMDRIERRYLGFRYARVTRPCLPGESACPYSESWFIQVEGRLPAGADGGACGWWTLLAKSEQVYNALPASAPYSRLLSGSWSYAYGSGGEFKRTHTTYAYDSYGNTTQVTEYGDADSTGDGTTTLSQYTPPTPRPSSLTGGPRRSCTREPARPARCYARRCSATTGKTPGRPPWRAS